MIKNVNAEILSDSPERIEQCKQVYDSLYSDQCFYRSNSSGAIPWLISENPWKLEPEIQSQLKLLGEVVFKFFDALQCLYESGHQYVIETLDIGVSDNLRGLQLTKPLQFFRLDILVSNKKVYLTEIEEVFGGAGVLAAMESAYGINYDSFYRLLNEFNIKNIYIDDTFLEYGIEMKLLSKRLGGDIKILPFSKFNPNNLGVSWRFCYTKDLSQYSLEIIDSIISSTVHFINPLFHGYSSKLALALLFHEGSKEDLKILMGEKDYHTLIKSVPRTILLNKDNFKLYDILNTRKSNVLKVADCRDDINYNWGSRGVYFGSSMSQKKWKNILNEAMENKIPEKDIYGSTYMVMEQIESDRYDIPFYNPCENAICLMNKARLKLGPIYTRINNKVEMGKAMEATFVNTSRKVHVGTHAVVAPVILGE
jgi:hypothetical protein